MFWKNIFILLACIIGASATCQNIPTSLTINGITITLKLVGKGQTGCAFHVVNGWPRVVRGSDVRVPAIAKVLIPPPQRPNLSFNVPEKPGLLSEVDSLKRVEQFYFYDANIGGHEWIVLKEYPSSVWKRVDKTKAWGEFFGPGKLYQTYTDDEQYAKCADFVNGIAAKATNAVGQLVQRFGVFQRDYHYGNFLANDDLSQFQVIDFGSTSEMSPEQFEGMGQQIFDYLTDDSQLPLQDTTYGDASDFAGVCQSDLRKEGGKFSLPFPPDAPVGNKKRSSQVWGRRN